MKLIDSLLYLLLPGVVLVHLAVAPYTKVEESFNLQAAHDVLVYGTPTGPGAGARLAERYDHFTFPGAVPRTFVGAVLLAGLGQPLLAGWELVRGALFPVLPQVDGPAAQLVVRGILGLANAGAMVTLGHSLSRACGRAAGRWYLVLQAAQFHAVFYASRTLPNSFAFFLTTLAFAFLLRPQGGVGGQGGSSAARARARAAGRVRVALCLLAFAGVVFRAEVAVLLAAVAAYLVVAPLASVEQIIRTVAVASAVALALSVPVDTYFWQKGPFPPFWPELRGFIFNVLHGQASEWGVMPWHYYATSALPRLLLNPLVPLLLVPVALARPATRGPASLLVWPSLLFVAVYSLQPHKEARFVLYVVPPLTAAAALGADQIVKNRRKGLALQAGAAAVALSVPLAFAASAAMLLVSALNYPGGEALAALRDIIRADHPGAAAAAASAVVVAAHADVLSCMTGVTLFGAALGPILASTPPLRMADLSAGGGKQSSASGAAVPVGGAAAGPQLVVDKTEDARRLADPTFWLRFDYVLTEDPSKVGGAGIYKKSRWEPAGVVQGYAGVEVLRPGQADPDDQSVRGQTTPPPPVVGHGAAVARVRRAVRGLTGGWWVGPRMAPQVHIMRRVKDTPPSQARHEAAV